MQSSNNDGSNQHQHQHQWVALQYHAPPMFMPPPPPPPPYMPYHHHHHQPPVTQSGGEDNKSIWVGDLHNWMDEDYIRNCFASTREVASIKVIRNKFTGISEGYGFVEFHSHAAAEKVLQTYVSMFMPNTEQPFHLNWATVNRGDNKRSNVGSDLSIFVGDLAADVTDTLLHETFAEKYPSVKEAKVVIDLKTKRSKGYGFVKFGDDNERNQAMKEMNGVVCSSRPMRIAVATPRKSAGFQHGVSMSNSGYQSDGDPNNTTIFVGGLDHSVSDEDLRQLFTQYGEVLSVKIPIRKGCGFVQFANRNNAEEALEKLNGTEIGKQTVRLSWGRNPANKKWRNDFGNHWQAAYYGGQIYDGYGYALQSPHGRGMYGGPYGSYAIYGAYQQQVS